MPINPDVYRTLLAELAKARHTVLPDTFQGRLNVPRGRQAAMIHEALVQSEIEMRLAMEREERELHLYSASSLTTDGGGPKAVNQGPTYDPDATAYFAAVASNGGTITSANKTAFNTAFLALKSTNANDGSSLWSHINQGYFFFGQESYSNGLFVPFYNTNTGSGLQPITTSPATPNGTAFTYTKTGGLVFDGSTNYIDTGINNATTGGVGGSWPVTTTTGPSNNRHGYSYITNTGQSFGASIAFVPFGQGATTSTRAFQLNLTDNHAGKGGRLYNNSATSGIVNSSQIISDGGWGIPSPQYLGGLGINAVFGANRGASISVATPATTSLLNSNIFIGYGANTFSSGNFLASTFGCSFNGGAADFALLDGIINTLVTSLT